MTPTIQVSRWRFFVAVAALALLGIVVYSLVQPGYLFLSGSYQPGVSLDTLLQRTNHQLPREDADLDLLLTTHPAAVSLYDVDNWEIEVISVHDTGFWDNPSDDDPIYWLEVILRVQYANGSDALLRWSTWRYGLVVGPFVLGGDGPWGKLEMLGG